MPEPSCSYLPREATACCFFILPKPNVGNLQMLGMRSIREFIDRL